MRILLVSHGYPPSASGGTEVYTRQLALALARDSRDQVWVLTREADRCRPEYAISRYADGPVQVISINNTFQACESFEDSYAHPALLQAVLPQIEAVAPDVVHVQHLTCLSTLIPGELARRRIPCVLTLNDYWLICHRGQLFDAHGLSCEGPFDGGCSGCVPTGALASPLAFRAGRIGRSSPVPGVAAAAAAAIKTVETLVPASRTRGATLRRLAHMREATAAVDLFLAPSATIESRFLRFGVPRERLRRCEQGVDLGPFQGLVRSASGVLRIGYAGGLVRSKGPLLLLEAAGRLPASRICVDVLGDPPPAADDPSYAGSLAPLVAAPFVRRTGAVPHDRMPAALAEIDVLVVPSLWLENAPFLIREASAARVPVVASRAGGMAEMVRDGVDGLLFEQGSSESLRAALHRLLDEPGLLDRLRAGLQPPMSIVEDATRLRATYEDLGRSGGVRVRRPVPPRASGAVVGAVVVNYRTPDQTWLAVRSLQTSQDPPAHIVVVDNASGDGSVDRLRAALPAVEIVENAGNLGFSGGCNVGLRRVLDLGAEFALLVNSDVVVRPDAPGALLEAAARHPGAGLFSPVLVSRDEPDHIASAGIDFDDRTGRMRHRAAGLPLSLLRPWTPHEVDAISGAVMLIRADILRHVGWLEEDLFFYFEDIEFCFRARRGGFASMCVPGAVAYHAGGQSIGRRSPRRVYFATRNHLRVARELGQGGPFRRAARAGLVVGLNAAYALTAPDVPLGPGLLAVLRGTRDHLRGRYGSD